MRESVFGMIMNGVLYGPIAGIATNISVAISCGIGSGFISTLFFAKIYPCLNNQKLYDNAGVLLMLILSILGTCLVTPITLWLYHHYDIELATLQANSTSAGEVISSKSIVGYALYYPLISAFIGGCSGLIIGLLMRCFDPLDSDLTMTDKMYFFAAHGLRPMKEKKKQKRVIEVNPLFQKKTETKNETKEVN